MGSGLILLAIVGAWLAVLVPMALRRYDTSHLVTVDRFHDAMRVLSRRGTDPEPDPGTPAPAPRISRVRAVAGSARGVAGSARGAVAARRSRPPATAAARRRRVLIALVLLSVGTLAGAVLGPLWLVAPHLVADLLLVAFVVHLRKAAVRRAEREWRAAMRSDRAVPAPRRAEARRVPAPAAAPGPAAPPAAAAAAAPARPVLRPPVHVAGIPDRMPPRPAPLAPAAEVPAARGAQGEAWSPVPVPAPTYLSAPAAPRRVVDVTRPGSYAEDGLTDAEREIGIVDEGPQLEEILERRRAVNDW